MLLQTAQRVQLRVFAGEGSEVVDPDCLCAGCVSYFKLNLAHEVEFSFTASPDRSNLLDALHRREINSGSGLWCSHSAKSDQ
jgi:hypothetical protein